MRIIVLSTYPELDASRRLRVTPLVNELRSRGHEVRCHTLLSDWIYRRKNRGTSWKLVGACLLFVSLVKRLVIVALLTRRTVVIVHREAFPFFTPSVERIVRHRCGAMVVDVDDALHRSPTHVRDWRTPLRNPANYAQVLERASLALCGSPYMLNYARSLGAPAIFAPTCPPPGRIACGDVRENLILWTGSFSTLGSLVGILPEIKEFCQDSGWRVVALGGENIRDLPDWVERAAWNAQLEEQLLARAKVGLMPLPDSEWEQGKSAYKALLYMSRGVSPLVSPVGMNAWLCEQFPGLVTPVPNGKWGESLRKHCGENDQGLAAPEILVSAARSVASGERVMKLSADTIEAL